MHYYQKHLFFCVKQRESGQCCADHFAQTFKDYAKKRINALGLHGEGQVRVSQAGCLGRCKQGPVLVVYPDEVWYTYAPEQDIDEIIDKHIIHNQLVERLLIPKVRIPCGLTFVVACFFLRPLPDSLCNLVL